MEHTPDIRPTAQIFLFPAASATQPRGVRTDTPVSTPSVPAENIWSRISDLMPGSLEAPPVLPLPQYAAQHQQIFDDAEFFPSLLSEVGKLYRTFPHAAHRLFQDAAGGYTLGIVPPSKWSKGSLQTDITAFSLSLAYKGRQIGLISPAGLALRSSRVLFWRRQDHMRFLQLALPTLLLRAMWSRRRHVHLAIAHNLYLPSGAAAPSGAT